MLQAFFAFGLSVFFFWNAANTTSDVVKVADISFAILYVVLGLLNGILATRK